MLWMEPHVVALSFTCPGPWWRRSVPALTSRRLLKSSDMVWKQASGLRVFPVKLLIRLDAPVILRWRLLIPSQLTGSLSPTVGLVES
jgi:hypothetical protein